MTLFDRIGSDRVTLRGDSVVTGNFDTRRPLLLCPRKIHQFPWRGVVENGNEWLSRSDWAVHIVCNAVDWNLSCSYCCVRAFATFLFWTSVEVGVPILLAMKFCLYEHNISPRPWNINNEIQLRVTRGFLQALNWNVRRCGEELICLGVQAAQMNSLPSWWFFLIQIKGSTFHTSYAKTISSLSGIWANSSVRWTDSTVPHVCSLRPPHTVQAITCDSSGMITTSQGVFTSIRLGVGFWKGNGVFT